MESGPDFEGIVSLLSSEQGGRKSYTISGYRPQIVLAEEWVTSAGLTYLEVDRLLPGESALTNISLLSPKEDSLWVGRKLRIEEGRKVVGSVVVTKIYNPVLIRNS